MPDPLQRYVDKAGLDDIRLQQSRARATSDAKKQDHDAEALAGQGTEAQAARYLGAREPRCYTPRGLNNN